MVAAAADRRAPRRRPERSSAPPPAAPRRKSPVLLKRDVTIRSAPQSYADAMPCPRGHQRARIAPSTRVCPVLHRYCTIDVKESAMSSAEPVWTRPRGLTAPPQHDRYRHMQIGKAGEPVTRISHASPDRVEVRGQDLDGDLMGRLTFTEYFHLLLTGREPTRRRALLPRPDARLDRRARADAEQRRRADDARGGSWVAPGGRRRQASSAPGP